ncbi:MAG: AAA family ATPase [Chloroflexi bacterium]|nr:AAA family ATPase [Chloroflexota bacterium]
MLVQLWDQLARPWQVCLEEAWAAYRAGSLPIGAVVVSSNGAIVGRGRNRIFEPPGDQPLATGLAGHRLAHAEINALLSVDHAALDVRASVLYTTLEPCALCVGAIRMLGLRQVHYAARDPVAGGLCLLDATSFMRRGEVQAHHLGNADLEAVLVAMHVDAHLSLVQRSLTRADGRPWDGIKLPGVTFGRDLFASGHLQRLAGARVSPQTMLSDLLAHCRQDASQASHVKVPYGTRRPVVLIITGPPASGKSTLGRQLAHRLGLALLSKDLFKEVLFDELGWFDREWSRRLGSASMVLLFRSALALLEADQSVALEANFYPEWDTDSVRMLAETSRCRFVQLVCSASPQTLVDRYRRRSLTGERHPGHVQSEALDETLERLASGRWDALDLEGPVITVDTEVLPSEGQIEHIVEQVRDVLENQ